MFKKVSLMVVCVLCSAALLVAESAPLDSMPLSLSQALSLAMKHNPLVRTDRLDVTIAETFYREQLYRYEPTLSISIAPSQRVTDSIRPDPTIHGSLQVNQATPVGGSVQAFASSNPNSSRSPTTIANGDYTRTVGVSFSQALLQGGGLGVTLAPLRKARIDSDLRREELASYAQRLLAETERAYWDLFLAKRESVIREESLELANRLLYESEERLRVGRLAPLDLAIIRAEVASREKALIDAHTAQDQKRLRLLYLIGDTASIGWESALVPTDTLPQPETPDSLGAHTAVALRLRPDLRMARLQAQRGEIEVVATRNGLLPKLDFFVALQGTAFAESFVGPRTASHERDITASGGLTVTIPASNGAARQRHARSTLIQAQSTLALANFERLTEMEIRSTYAEVVRARQQIAAARTVTDLQEEKLIAEQEKLAAGKSTNYLVMLAQRDLTAAKLDQARAGVSYVNTLTDLHLKDGSLLERRGVSSGLID